MSDNEQIVAELLNEFKQHRDAIMDMISDLEKIKENINRLFPEKLDHRYVRFFEEKVKSMTGLFNALLDMRKEITKNLKDEIEIRRKVTHAEKERDISDVIDIRGLVTKVEDLQKKKDEIRKKHLETAKRETDEISKTIDVTKVSNG